MDKEWIDRSILYSILDKRPKKAEVYWFVKVNVTDEPYTSEYEVDMLGTDFIVCVNLYLGFHMRQEIPRYLRTIVTNLMNQDVYHNSINLTVSFPDGRLAISGSFS